MGDEKLSAVSSLERMHDLIVKLSQTRNYKDNNHATVTTNHKPKTLTSIEASEVEILPEEF